AATLPRRSSCKRPVIRTNSGYSKSGRSQLTEAAPGHRLEQRFARRALVVPGDPDLTEQVRVRRLETIVALEHLRETHDAALATDAADLDRLALSAHSHNARRSRTKAAVRSTDVAWSGARISSVPKRGCRRTSHQKLV